MILLRTTQYPHSLAEQVDSGEYDKNKVCAVADGNRNQPQESQWLEGN